VKPNILVCGKTGVGKTSLIQAVTQIGTVPDSAIGHGQPTTKGFDLYETDIANFIDAEGMEPGQTIDEYVEFIKGEMIERLDSNAAENVIHAIWYCIDGAGARIQVADEQFIKAFDEKGLIVVTKAEIMRENQYEPMIKVLSGLIEPERITIVSSQSHTGLTKLMEKSLLISEKSAGLAKDEIDSFNARWEKYYLQMVAGWKKRTDNEANSLIRWAAGRAAAIAFVPFPLADLAPLIANEAYMIQKIAGIYGYAINESIATMLRSIAGGSIVGKVLASFIPVLKIPIATVVTFGVGNAAKAYFSSDMKLNPSELKKEFKKGEKEAKKIDWKEHKVEDDV